MSEGLYIGGRTGTDPIEPVYFDADDLTTHGVIVGMTGSGKTGFAVTLLEEVLLAGVPVIAIDPKGDLGNLALRFPDFSPERFEPWVADADVAEAGGDRAGAAAAVAQRWQDGLAGWNIGPDRVAASVQAADTTIYTPGSTAGVPLNVVGSLAAPAPGAVDVEAQRQEISGYVTSLLSLAGEDADPVASPAHTLLSTLIERSWANQRDLNLAQLIGQVLDPPIRKLGVFDLDTFYPPDDRRELAMRLNTLVASPSFASWLAGPPLSIPDLLHGPDGRPRASVLSIAHLSDAQRQAVIALVLGRLITWMRGQPGSGALRALVYIDEVFGLAPPTAAPPSKQPILTLLKQARAYGVGMVLATQNPVDLDYKAMSNAATWVVGRLQTERDKSRIVEGLRSVRGDVDVDDLDRRISGLDKRQFVLQSAHLEAPVALTSRWAMSYLAGPLTTAQLRTLTADDPARTAGGSDQTAATAPATGQDPGVTRTAASGAAAAIDTAATITPSATSTASTDAAAATGAATGTAAPATGTAAPANSTSAVGAPAGLPADATIVQPPVADGVPVRWLDPAAPWGNQVEVAPDGQVCEAAVVARVALRYDERAADLDHRDEWEAVLYPIGEHLDPADAIAVDYDDRDLREQPPAGVSYRIPDAPINTKTWWRSVESDLKDHLRRNQQITVLYNPELKLYSRVNETREQFLSRADAVAQEQADAETAKLTDAMRRKEQSLTDKLERAQQRVEQLEVDEASRKRGDLITGAGQVLSAIFGGSRSTRSVVTGLGRAAGSIAGRRGTISRTAQRRETAEEQAQSYADDVAQLEDQLADELVEIDARWREVAQQVDEVDVGLERDDIDVTSVALLWIRRDA